MHMFTERLQILISLEQRRRWEAEASRRGTSIAGLIREAVDRDLGVLHEERDEAVDAIRAMRGRSLSPSELERVIEEERARAGPP